MLLLALPGFGQVVNSQAISRAAGEPAALALRLGADDLLVSGEVYLPEYPKAKGHPYYPDEEWTEGTVYAAGRAFAGVLVKYNLALDRPLLQTRMPDGQRMQLVLVATLVDSFQILGRTFVRANAVDPAASNNGYFEQVYRGKINLLVRHEKYFVATYSSVSPFGSYSTLRSKSYLLTGGQLIPVSDKRAFLDYFAAKKDLIKQYIRQTRIAYPRATYPQLHQLMHYCNALPSSTLRPPLPSPALERRAWAC